jgi:hypothetical protein
VKFDGLEPFRTGFPTTLVGDSARQFDLHNDADLREFSVDVRGRIVRLDWVLKKEAWRTPGLPESQRTVIAGLGLLFSDVSLLVLSGAILESATSVNELDFIDFAPAGGNSGEVRIVLANSAEIRVVASGCELRLIERD